MTNKEKLEKLIKTYEKDIDDNNFKRFVNEVLSNCGSIALKKIEDAFGTMISYYRDIYVIIDDVVFTADKKELVKYSPEKTNSEYIIPECVERVGINAFQGCEYLKHVTLSKNIRRIDSGAFSDCQMLSEVIWAPPKATGGSYVFENCPKLKTVITDDAQKLFGYKCDNYGSPFINGACLIVDGKVCENLSIPDDADITLRAFQGCTSIKNVEFKENNKYIEKLLLSIVDNKGILI